MQEIVEHSVGLWEGKSRLKGRIPRIRHCYMVKKFQSKDSKKNLHEKCLVSPKAIITTGTTIDTATVAVMKAGWREGEREREKHGLVKTSL